MIWDSGMIVTPDPYLTKTRLVHHEDDRRAVVPPQFVDFLNTKDTKISKDLINALCDWLFPVHAITGNPVTVYSAMTFLRQYFKATSAIVFCEGFQPRAFFSISPQITYYS